MSFFTPDNEEHQQLAAAFNQGTYADLPQSQVMSSYQGFIENTPPQQVQELSQEYFGQMPQAERSGLFGSLLGAMSNHQPGFDPRQAGISTTDPNRASAGDLGNLFNIASSSGLLGGLMGGGRQQQAGGLGGMLGGLMGGGQPQPQQQGGLGGLLGGLMGGGQSQQPVYNDPRQQPGYGSQAQPGLGGTGGGIQDLMRNPLAQAAISGLIGYAANRVISGVANRASQPRQTQSQQPDYNQADQYQQQPNYPNNRTYQATNTSSQGQVVDLGGGGSALPGFEDEQPR